MGARIASKEIDQLYVGQDTEVRFAAFDQQLTPQVDGELINISADLTKDPNTGEPHFTARIAISDLEIAKLGDNKLKPGVPADVQIKTTDRTALSYLMKPLMDQVSKALREL